MFKLKSTIITVLILFAAVFSNAETVSLVCDPYPGEEKIETMQVEVIHNDNTATYSVPYALDKDGDIFLLDLDGYEPGKYTFRVRPAGWSEWGELTAVKRGKPNVRVK